ncbi:hypothetical protein C2E20_3539 [Micractinium conductrix]|uniref:Uncharacterized protein n=1 Tax=Micractinium conductrix TaxID=554055 RepID=A0A2P6VGQ7_9CHLO|nr:hypothetical protein C2E20_3539 [Micractinium conductrix]|eukprot:PSC73270.1 hypothetical protein C2E20_3539 [Micractinium conductrix]
MAPPQQQRRQPRCRRRRLQAAAAGDSPGEEGSALASEFHSFINEQGMPELLRDRRPTHLMSPLACIAAQMGALQRNDWPERDAGVQTAFQFTLCQHAEELLSAQASPGRVRSWAAREEWLPLPDFSNQLHSPPFAALLNCDSWRPTSPLVFPSQRHTNKAVAAVEVVPAGGGQHAQAYTFCLERVTAGPYKNCWLTVGVRQGDYAGV